MAYIMYKLIILLVNYLNYSSSQLQTELCGWLVETVDFISLVPAHRHYLGILREQLMININSSDIFDYMLKLSVGCNGKTNEKLMRSLILQGVCPNVELIIKSGENEQPTTHEYILRSLLVPVNDSSVKFCHESDCPSVWFVPFPVRNTSITARVLVSSGGIGYPQFDLDLNLDVAHLFQNNFEMDSNLVPFKKGIQKLLDLAPLYVHVNPENEMSTSINLLPDQPLVLVASSDFRKYFFTEIIPNETNFSRVCVNSSQKVQSVMFLSSVNLVGTEFGLLAQKNKTFHLVSHICVNQMATERDAKTQVVLIVSSHSHAKDKCGSVAVAYIDPKTSTWPTFVEIKDHWGSNIHKYCQRTLHLDCCLVSSALAQKASGYYFLVLNDHKDIYYILEFNRPKKTWSTLCSLNATVYLSRLLVHDAISEVIVFAYGSVIFMCQSKKQTLIDVNNSTEQDIIQLLTVHDNFFLFLRREKKIGIGQIGSESVYYVTNLWSRFPLDFNDLVGVYKAPSGTPMLLNAIAKPEEKLNTDAVELKSIMFDHKHFIEQFIYNENLRQGLEIQDCTIGKIDFSVENMTKLTGIKTFQLVPSENYEDTAYNSKQAIYLYQGVASFISTSDPSITKTGYRSLFKDATSKWQHDQDSIVFTSLADLKEKIKQRSVFELQAKNYKQVYKQGYSSDSGCPSTVYLDIGDVFIAQVSIHYAINHSYSKLPIQIIHSKSQLETRYFEVNKTGHITTYEIQVRGTADVYTQYPISAHLIPAVVEFRFLDDNEKSCIQGLTEPQGKYKMRVLLGCPPSKHLLFDWFKTVSLNKYHFEDNYDCTHPEANKPCFDFYGEFSPVFTVVDDVAGIEEIYTDPLMFLVVGGGAVGEGIRLFSSKEILDYNFLNGTEHHAIWRPDHHAEHAEDEHGHEQDEGYPYDKNIKKRLLGGYRVLHNKVDDSIPFVVFGGRPVHWMCEWHSPCGNVDPDFPDDAQYDLLIEVTNRGFPSNFTNCDLTLRFVIRIHGLPASLIHKALPQLAIAVGFISVFFICYHCLRVFRKKLNNELGDVSA